MVDTGAREREQADRRRSIAAIHASATRVVIEFAGAGAQALAWLHEVAGSSGTVLEATDRYHPASVIEALGSEPASFASAEVARGLAVSAYARACALSEGDPDRNAQRGGQSHLAGLGWTATIATDRAKRGGHRCFVATCDAEETRIYRLELTNGARARDEEEHVVSLLVLRALGELCRIDAVAEPVLVESEQIERTVERAGLIERMHRGEFAWVAVWPGGARSAGRRCRQVALVSGSFNPLHEGHLGIAVAAASALGREVWFELPLVNADKSAISAAEAERRLAQFRGVAPLLLTRLPRFVDKARCFPGSVFVIGADTLARLLEPRFYRDQPGGVDGALHEVAAAGCRFLVAGRLDPDHRTFVTVDDVALPNHYRHLFQGIAQAQFRRDVSSTELRERMATESPEFAARRKTD